MKNILTSAFLAILALAFTPSVQAQTNDAAASSSAAATTAASSTTPTPTTLSTSSKTVKTPYKGTITAISATSVTISGTKPMTLTITPATTYKVGHKKAAATDFAVGDAITVSYSIDATGATVANSIHKKKPAAAAAQ